MRADRSAVTTHPGPAGEVRTAASRDDARREGPHEQRRERARALRRTLKYVLKVLDLRASHQKDARAVDPLLTFAENVRRTRHAAGLTQETLGERADLPVTYIGRIERAERDPGVRTVSRLARGLGVEVAELFAGVPQADDTTPRRRTPTPRVATSAPPAAERG